MNKHDTAIVTIEDITDEGLGVGKAAGFPLFIKDTVPGDEVLAEVIKDKKTYGFARVLKLLKASTDRVRPRCDAAESCGGCDLQSMAYPAQLKFKKRKVAEALSRIGGIENPCVEDVIGMDRPWNYRCKAEYPVRAGRDGNIKIGFYARHSHDVIENGECLIGREDDAIIIEAVRKWMLACGITPYNEELNKGVLRHVLIRTSAHTGEKLVCLIINAQHLRAFQEKMLVRLMTQVGARVRSLSYCVNRKKTNTIMGSSVHFIYGDEYIEDRIGENIYRISPQSFYQINPEQTERLYECALEYAGLCGNEVVWDLYCGIGTISLFLANRARKVYGVEIIPRAVEDAKVNAEINNITNAEFFCGKAEIVLPEFYNNYAHAIDDGGKIPGGRAALMPDVIVVDPPRKGCDPELIACMLKMSPEKIVYVSCNPATLARDVRLLSDGGYELKKVQPVDMFPQTVHVETVVLMSRESL